MPTFKYTAKKPNGKVIKKKIIAGSKEQAVSMARSKGVSVVSIEEVPSDIMIKIFGEPKPRMKGDLLPIFTRQLSTMLSAGIPLLESLEILSEQADDIGFCIVLGKVVNDLRGGSDFSESIAKYPKIFDRIYVSMIKAGEAGGQLDAILSRLADYMEASAKLKREIKSAMTYPVISLVLIFTIVSLLLVFIVPKFKTIFTSMGIDLPGITVMLLAASDFVQARWYVIIGIIFGIFVGYKFAKKTKLGRKLLDIAMLKMPVFGELNLKVSVSRFAKTFATLIQSGVPILGALDIVAATSGNSIIENAVLAAKENVKKGETLGEPLSKSKVFPPMVTRMITIGEKSGALESLLEKISEFYDSQVETMVASLTSLIEPIMIGIMGIVVGGMVLAIFMPILKMQAALSGG